MSIAPLPTGPTVAPATPTGETGSSGETADGTFAALVSSLLDEGQPKPADGALVDGAVVPPGSGEVPVDPAATEDEAETAGETVAAATTPLWQVLTGQVAPGTTASTNGVVAAQQNGTNAVATVSAPGATTGDAGAVTPATAATQSAAAAAVPAGPTVAEQPGAKGGEPSLDAAVSVKITDGTATGASSETAQGESGDQPAAASARAVAEAEVAPAPASTSSSGAAPATAPVTAASTAPTTSTDSARPMPVVSQLAPEVTRLVSNGDGLHRLTMLLQPEALGEVRVTLTVRDGEVLVRLAAGDDAQRALLEGAPELRRVLELAGASDARVVVRDLHNASQGNQQGWGQSSERSANPDSSGAFGSGGDTSASGRGRTDDQDQHARTRGGSTARDGLTDGAAPLRPNPVADASRGIDLTM